MSETTTEKETSQAPSIDQQRLDSAVRFFEETFQRASALEPPELRELVARWLSGVLEDLRVLKERVALKERTELDPEKYPDGKLNAQDEGELSVGLAIDQNTVVMAFTKPVTWLGFDRVTGTNFANALLEKVKQLS